jgi:hypothetical protein
MMTIPLRAVPNQVVTFVIGSQNQQNQVNVYQKSIGMFLDLYVNEEPVLSAVLCRNLTPLVINSYIGFPTGDLIFVDTLGLNADPLYTGLGTRWFLLYVAPSDVVPLGLRLVFF